MPKLIKKIFFLSGNGQKRVIFQFSKIFMVFIQTSVVSVWTVNSGVCHTDDSDSRKLFLSHDYTFNVGLIFGFIYLTILKSNQPEIKRMKIDKDGDSQKGNSSKLINSF